MVQSYAALVEGKIRTFSIGFREEQFSELPFARQVASRFHTDHHEQVVTPEASEILQDLIHFFDEPFADSSAVPSLYLARLASEHVKVVISGDGGDEAFGGYTRYAHDLKEARLRRQLPKWLCLRVLRPLGRYWPKADWLPRVLRAKTALTNLSLDPQHAYANTVTLCRLPLRRQLLRHEVVARLQDNRPEDYVVGHYDEGQPDDPLAAMICADVHLLLPDDFLTKVDRASMSCGLEVRPPLVDHELLELAAQVPSNLKLRDGETKWIFKRLFRDRLPEEVSQRPKQGFEIPIDLWLRGPLQEVFESAVLRRGAPVADWIDQSVVRRLYGAHQRHIGRHGNVLWALLVLALWCQEYLGPRHEKPLR
jgi:asparagine synthase (glutamine-hydrolysing)